MRSETHLLVALALSLACNADVERDPYANPPSSHPPHATQRNEAPLGNVSEAQRELAAGETPTPGVVETAFEPLARSTSGGAIDAKADLTEAADGVHVHLRIEHAMPGRARLVVERAPCKSRWAPGIRAPTALEQRGATPAVLTSASGGDIVIHENGQADYATVLSHVSLDPGKAESLAGKALVVYEAPRLREGTRTSEVPVACAMVPRERPTPRGYGKPKQ